MAFRTEPRTPAPRGLAGSCVGMCRSVLLLLTKLTISILLLAVLAGGVLYLRLMQGPLELPMLGRLAADRLNAADNGHNVEIGGLQVDLEAGRGLSAIQLTDVSIADEKGAMLFSLPRVGATLGLSDLLHGKVAPERITVKGPRVVLTRISNGELHLQVGDGQGISLAATQDQEASANAMEAVMAQLVGDVPAADALSALSSVRIDDVTLTYVDRVLDASWQSSRARLELSRFKGGARAVVSADVIDVPGQSASVRLVAERFAGQKDLRLIASFGEISTGVVAAQLPGLAWLNVLEGSIEGRALAIVDPDGQVSQLGGTVIAENGQLQGWGEKGGFDIAELKFEMDPARDLIRLERGILSANAVDTAVRGLAHIRRDSEGAMTGLAGQLSIDRIYAQLPELFTDPVSFEAGELNFRWGFADNLIEIADSSVASDGLVFQLDGRALETEDGWVTDLRAQAQDMTIEGLLTHWPLATAKNARDWVADNISQADIPQFLAQMRLGSGEPHLSLDFTFQDLNSTYIDGMSPIRGAAGRGQMSYHDLFLDFDRAQVVPRGFKPIELGGSTVAIRDFWGEVTPADIQLNASGETAAILALIDQKPLSLVSKLGIDLGRPGGSARVISEVEFPLIADLLLEQVDASATASFRGFDLALDLGRGGPLRVTGDGIALNADTVGMSLNGAVEIDGIPATVKWDERYGGRNTGRTLDVKARTTPKLMAMLGADDLPIKGQAPFTVSLKQQGNGPARFDLDMDLKPVDLSIDGIGWRKRSGQDGRLTARGALSDAVSIDAFSVRAGGLLAEGALDIGKSGGLRGARLDRVVVPGLADVAGTVTTGADDVLEIDINGGSMDLSGQLDDEDANDRSDEPGTPMRLAFKLDRLLLTDKIGMSRARGRFNRTPDGSVDGSLSGNLGGEVPLELQLTRPSEGGGTLSMSSPDAGAALEAADLYRGAKGGKLVLNAQFGRGDASALTGSVRIEDITVRSESTFRRVLRQGGLDQAEQQVTRSGLGFRKIWIPFVYENGVLTLSDAIATSATLALKVNGTLDEETEVLDLSGVMSPAYALTGAFNEIPVLGKILSGGEGEGILAMTFTLRGPARDPDLSVNPLSLLAPGFLRNLFRGGQPPQDSSFADRIKRQDR